MEEMKVRYETTGTPQGGVVSPLLANIFPFWVKRQYVCKQLTIERRDENSNGTP